MNKRVGLVIGRFQPIHDGHTLLIKEAARKSDRLIILVGSANASITVRNPFNYQERKLMIQETLSEFDNITIAPVEDFFYVQNGWIKEVQRIIDDLTYKDEEITLFGHFKDATSSYLNWFPQWNLHNVKKESPVDATWVRNHLFAGSLDMMSKYVNIDVIEKYLTPFLETPRYFELVSEYNHTNEYKKAWESAPFPPTFVTTDAIVVQSGHVLIVKRKVNPGKGKYAIPGGFLNQEERLEDGAIRELKEETKIDLPKPILKASIKDNHVFDYPWRSMRGRTITHAYYIKLDDSKPLPKVVGSDDAEKAFWMPFNSVIDNAENFFEDHLHIIKYFIGL